MRILILGITGMLGHKLCQVLSSKFNVTGTVKGDNNVIKSLKSYEFFINTQIIPKVDARTISSIESVVNEVKPEVVINCIGIVKNIPEEKDVVLNIMVNALFPHQLHDVCKENNIRLIHISTDCIFSGEKGNYTENDLPNAYDVYGKTKYLGELSGENTLTIRTSLIGRELFGKAGLVEWLISNNSKIVKGFTNAIFSGFTTLQFAHIIADILLHHPDLNGIYNISSEPISKFDLLTLLCNGMKLDIDIEKSDIPYCDRSLDSKAYRNATGFVSPSWDYLINQFVSDVLKYDNDYKKRKTV